MLASSKLKCNSIIGAGKAPKRTNKHSQNYNEQQRAKKATLLLYETKKYDSKKHREKTDITGKINLCCLPTARNFCVVTTQGKRLCVAAIATKHARCKRFLLKKKQKNAPRGVLSSNQILAVFFKKKSDLPDWSKLISSKTR